MQHILRSFKLQNNFCSSSAHHERLQLQRRERPARSAIAAHNQIPCKYQPTPSRCTVRFYGLDLQTDLQQSQTVTC